MRRSKRYGRCCAISTVMIVGIPPSPPARSKRAQTDDQVGAVRNFRLADGWRIREQLLALSDVETSFTYCILEAPVFLRNYVANVRLRRVTGEDACLWEWRASFDPPAAREGAASRFVAEDIIEAGFRALRELLVSGGANSRAARPTTRLRRVRDSDDRDHSHPLWRTGSPGSAKRLRRRPRTGRSANSTNRRRRQLHRRLLPPRQLRSGDASWDSGPRGRRGRRKRRARGYRT